MEPRLWFGDWDTQNFISESDSEVHNATYNFIENWVNKNLPIRTPRIEFRTPSIDIPDEILNHLQRIESNNL